MKLIRSIWLGSVLAALLGAAVLAALFHAGAVATRRDKALTPQQVFERASQSVVMIYAADAARKIVGRGSGVLVQEGVVLTSCHVIARGTMIRVRHNNEQWNGLLVAYDADRDVCLIAVQELRAAPAAVADTTALAIGQRVYAIGTPEGFELTFSEGLISGLRHTEHGRYIQTTAPISEGSSGGGLFDTRGRLIGITSFVYSAGQNLNFAVPADWGLDLARKLFHAEGEFPGRPVELPPGYGSQWRHPPLN